MITFTRIRVSSLGMERTLFSTSTSVTSIMEQLEFWSSMGNRPSPVNQGWSYNKDFNFQISSKYCLNIDLYFLECYPFFGLLFQHFVKQIHQLSRYWRTSRYLGTLILIPLYSNTCCHFFCLDKRKITSSAGSATLVYTGRFKKSARILLYQKNCCNFWTM